MKTKNNVQKAALKSVAVATGLVILSFTLNAQDEMKPLFENNEHTHLAMATEKTGNNTFSSTTNTRSFTKADAFEAYLTKETEEPLNVEYWMLKENNFVMSVEIEAETENPIELEDWMTNKSNFDANFMSVLTETEEELNLEDWMLDENNFIINQTNNTSKEPKVAGKVISTKNFVFHEVIFERNLFVEAWMINPKIWK